MRAFRYRLSAALKRAEQREQTCQAELARRRERLEEARRRMERLSQAQEVAAQRLRPLQHGVVEVDRVAALGREIERLGSLLSQAARLGRQLEEAVEGARQRLLEAARGRKVLETHRDGLALRHRRGELSAELKQLDDLSTVRFASASAEVGGAEPCVLPRSRRQEASSSASGGILRHVAQQPGDTP